MKRSGVSPGHSASSMFASDSCRSQRIRCLQLGWFVIFFLPLIIAFSSFNAQTLAEETKPKSEPGAVQTESTVKHPAANAQKDAAAAKDSEKKSTASDASEEKTVDAAEMLKAIRKSRAKKSGAANANDDLILSQSSGYLFLNRKRVRDVTDNILDHWYLSSFEDDLNLTLIVFEAVTIKPLTINLDPDIDARLSLQRNDYPLMNFSETARTLNPYINFPIPESVMVYINENSEETVSENASSFLPEMFSTYSYVVLILALLGFSILGYVIYRIVVWAFMLDQNREYDMQKGKDEEVVAPIDMNAYSAYFYQINPEEKR